ncbi:MAG: helix-turn-helix domain-containing protein [Terriglobia bacterium]
MDRRIEAALAIIESEYMKPLRVRDLPRRVGLSRSHLEFLFKRETGLTPRACPREVRLQRARALLQDGQLSVKAVAFSVGYRQPSNFNRDFRALFGDKRSGPQITRIKQMMN